MRNTLSLMFLVLVYGCATPDVVAQEQHSNTSPRSKGELQIEIQSPSADFMSTDGETIIQVEGVASTIGGVRYLDMIFVMDTSMSLVHTDPDDFRSAGAVGLVKNLSPKSDTKIGVVTFDKSGKLALPMTSDRRKVVRTLQELTRGGKTDIAGGIFAALAELEKSGRPGSSRVIMLFTDGKSNRDKAIDAMIQSQSQGVTIQTLLLGSDKKGAAMLNDIARGTNGSFVQVSDPTSLPEAFLNLRTTGVDSVTLSVNGSVPVSTRLTGGTFTGTVTLEPGENRIVALATSLDDQTRESVIIVNVRDASCAALEVAATNDGRPVVSLNDRSVEIIVDASRSMWGRMNGVPKMVVAKDILQDVSNSLPDELGLALRAYGSTSPSDDGNCADSALLVPFGEGNRWSIQQAIAGLRPLGQTPIAYALRQAAYDFGSLQDDRVIVLVTDGIESCGGDPVQAARELREQDIIVHIVGFGLGNVADEDAASLLAIAHASGGRYITAGNAEELKEALASTVGTSFRVFKGNTEIANGSLGSVEPLYLPGGDYRVELDSSPPQNVQVSLTPNDKLTLTMEKQAGVLSHFERSNPIEYRSCDDAIASIERLERGEDVREPLQSMTY